MRCCPSGADNIAGLFPGCFVHIRPGMDDEQNHNSGKANRLPAIPVRVRVWTAHSERIVKHQLRGFKAQAVIPFVGAVLFVAPRPMHTVPVFYVTTVL